MEERITSTAEQFPTGSVSNIEEAQSTVNVGNKLSKNVSEIVKWVEENEKDRTLSYFKGLEDFAHRKTGLIAKFVMKLDELETDVKELEKEKEKEERKLQEARVYENESVITETEKRLEEIEKALKNKKGEIRGYLKSVSDLKNELRSQFGSIKDTINRILEKDTTLAERIKILFREQGITIASVLTAVGMVIGFIVKSVIPGGGGTISPTPTPKDGSGVKDWIKKQLSNLGKLLAKLAGKAADALPGIIGAIVSWLLKTAGDVVSWFAGHSWCLIVLVAGLLYVAAKEYINKSRK